MRIEARTVRKLRSLAIIAAAGIGWGTVFGMIRYGVTQNGILLGMANGLAISLMVWVSELFIFQGPLRRLNLTALLGIRVLIYASLITMVLTTMAAALGESAPYRGWARLFQDAGFWPTFGFSSIAALLMSLFLAMDRIVGRGVLINFIAGHYRNPVEEDRAFMFLDLAGSTQIAEEIGSLRFYSLLKDFFYDLTEPIMEHHGHIYKYVGDEIIVAWRMRPGRSNADPVHCFFDICQVMDSRKDWYQAKYGLTLHFRAGIHSGSVITGEMGDYRQEIVFLGDVVNTTARLVEEAKVLNHRLLISGDYLSRAELPGHLTAEPMGSIKLRGKLHELIVYGVD
ncbi:MAG: adenylate/guanylate cyclase domain-containing protein [Solirubrobacterales bacterium]